jgi:hypothetical protein
MEPAAGGLATPLALVEYWETGILISPHMIVLEVPSVTPTMVRLTSVALPKVVAADGSLITPLRP